MDADQPESTPGLDATRGQLGDPSDARARVDDSRLRVPMDVVRGGESMGVVATTGARATSSTGAPIGTGASLDSGTSMSVSRRSLLVGGLAGGLGAAMASAGLRASGERQQGSAGTGGGAPGGGVPGVGTSPRSPVRNVIFVVADGMAAGTLGLTSHWSRLMRGEALHLERLGRTSGARRALCSTHSADSVVTDSAAASSAWSVGLKHRNGSLCITPDGATPAPWLMRCQQGGRGTGAVTTTTICHATPGGMYANSMDRGEYAAIGRQLADRKLDVALGGGRDHVNPAWLKDQNDCALVLTAAELQAWRVGAITAGAVGTSARPGSREGGGDGIGPRSGAGTGASTGAGTGGGGGAMLGGGAAERTPPRVVGLFNNNHMSMVLDRKSDEPALDVMTGAALERLSQHPGGFFLQVEAGRVDHAGHANDAVSLLAEMLEFDRTIALAAEFALARTDTLLVVTTDHATAGAAFTFYGRKGVDACKRLGNAKHSFDWIIDQFKALPGELAAAGQAAEMVRLLTTATGVSIGRELLGVLERHFSGEIVDPSLRRNQLVCVMGSIVGNSLGVQFVSPDHTADHVDVLALGKHAETLPSFVDNTELNGWIAGLMDLPPGTPVM